MALSGKLTAAYRGWTYRIQWTATQSASNNTSTITCKHYLDCASTYSLYIGTRSNSCTVGGVTKAFTSPRISTGGGSTITLGTTTHPVSHNADGTLKANVKSTFNIDATLSGTYKGSIAISATITLNTIPRASQPSCITWPNHTQNVGEFGDTISIHMNRASDSFTHTVRYQFGTASGTIAEGVTTGTTWTIPESLMDLMPSALKGSGTIYVDTYNGTTKIGTKSCGFTATVPASVVPTCSLQVLDATDVKDTYGNLVKGHSKLYIKTTGAGVHKSTIASYKAEVTDTATGQSIIYTDGAEVTTDVLGFAGTVRVRVAVTDSRGRTSSWASASFPVLDYVKPQVTALSVHRCDQDGTENDQGEYVKAEFSAQVTPLNNKNSARYKLYVKKTTQADDDYTGIVFTTTSFTPEYQVTKSHIFAADSDYSYDVVAEATDDFTTTARATTASTGYTFMDWNDDGKSLAFGKVSEEAGTLENALVLRQMGNRYSFSTPGVAGSAGYVCMAQLTHVAENADSPITFVFTRRLEASPMTVHVQFRTDSTTVDPELKNITYEGSNYGAFLVKVAESVWELYVQKVSAYDTITLQDWYSSRTIKGRLEVKFPGNLVSELPEGLVGYYRATPAKLQSILDFIYPVGSIYLSYSHVDPATLFGGTWERLENAFLWAVDESGTIGQTGGEKTHTLTVNEMPSHSHRAAKWSTSGTMTGYLPKTETADTPFTYALQTNAVGGGAAHNNMPPYIQVSAWRRTA